MSSADITLPVRKIATIISGDYRGSILRKVYFLSNKSVLEYQAALCKITTVKHTKAWIQKKVAVRLR